MKTEEVMHKLGDEAWDAFQKGDYSTAIRKYNQAIDKAREIKEHSSLAVFLTYQALCFVEAAEKERAIENLEEALEVSGEYPPILLNAKLVLAEIYRDSGNSFKSIDLFLDAFDLAKALSENSSEELALTNLGQLYLDRGWPEQASQCYRHILDSIETVESKAGVMGSLGVCMTELGKFEDGINYFRTAYLEAELEEDLDSMSVCVGSEGNVLFEMNEFDRAINCYEKAIAIAQKGGDANRVGVWKGNIGTTLFRLGRIDDALLALTEAEKIAGQSDDKHSQAAHLDSIGDCLAEKGELDKAKASFEKAIEISKLIEDRLGERIYLANLGRVFRRQGQLQPAFDCLGKAVSIFDEQRATICADDLKTSFANRGQDLFRDVVDVCMSMGKRVEALEFVGRAKSRALLDLLNNSPIDISTLADDGDESLKKLITKEKELRSQIDHLERVIWQGGTPDSSTRGATTSGEETKQVYSEWRECVNQLKGSHPNYATLVSAETLDFSEILDLWKGKDSALGNDTCVLEFFITEEYIMSLAVWADAKEPAVEILFDDAIRMELDMDIETFLEMSATEGWEVPKSLCKRIYDRLIAKILESIPSEINRLIIVPHGNLFHLPFAALYDGDKYLCQKYVLSYLPSTTLITVLTSYKETVEKPDKYLVSAISDYSATRENGLVLSSTLRSSSGLDDLFYTLEEADSIVNLSKLAKETKLLTNEEVKEVFPNLFSEYPVVHFAGHAVFNTIEPMASGLVLSDGTILTAASILERRSLKTRCGHLLVLSACQTGVNKVTAGGEVLGMARALIYAGMPNLILTLWEVADRSTSDLMKEFHDVWQSKGTSIAEALRDVQAQAIEQGLPIHAWAPFIHFGID